MEEQANTDILSRWNIHDARWRFRDDWTGHNEVSGGFFSELI